ncbi:hypothetical protein H5410_057124 [Solanum commersonii]|uniref:CCHC-type domain-containing protein n=1 Tax=Solanum commersonii TaxID=4109 RepID=A0A9J5WQ02_SOLCO|nr:hypothetical protein H5410_057124 [Solanum commersonii]
MIADTSAKHMSRRISNQDGDQRKICSSISCTTQNLTHLCAVKQVMILTKISHMNQEGLITLFVERIRKDIRGENHSISYDDYTYEKLISACVQEALSLCNEREFCKQFAFDIPKKKSKEKEYTPKKKKSFKKDYEKWKKKRIEKKLRRAKEKKEGSSKRRKEYRQNYNKSDTCHKCGRFGHYAKDFPMKEKIKSLDIDDNIKDSV